MRLRLRACRAPLDSYPGPGKRQTVSFRVECASETLFHKVSLARLPGLALIRQRHRPDFPCVASRKLDPIPPQLKLAELGRQIQWMRPMRQSYSVGSVSSQAI